MSFYLIVGALALAWAFCVLADGWWDRRELKARPCPDCNGHGTLPTIDDAYTCPYCAGTGKSHT